MSLIARDATLDNHVMIAGTEAANADSIKLHASLGFAEVGRMPDVGCKFGRRLDLVFMQKLPPSGVRP